MANNYWYWQVIKHLLSGKIELYFEGEDGKTYHKHSNFTKEEKRKVRETTSIVLEEYRATFGCNAKDMFEDYQNIRVLNIDGDANFED